MVIHVFVTCLTILPVTRHPLDEKSPTRKRRHLTQSNSDDVPPQRVEVPGSYVDR